MSTQRTAVTASSIRSLHLCRWRRWRDHLITSDCGGVTSLSRAVGLELTFFSVLDRSCSSKVLTSKLGSCRACAVDQQHLQYCTSTRSQSPACMRTHRKRRQNTTAPASLELTRARQIHVIFSPSLSQTKQTRHNVRSLCSVNERHYSCAILRSKAAIFWRTRSCLCSRDMRCLRPLITVLCSLPSFFARAGSARIFLCAFWYISTMFSAVMSALMNLR
jgi:hypothetical protein